MAKSQGNGRIRAFKADVTEYQRDSGSSASRTVTLSVMTCASYGGDAKHVGHLYGDELSEAKHPLSDNDLGNWQVRFVVSTYGDQSGWNVWQDRPTFVRDYRSEINEQLALSMVKVFDHTRKALDKKRREDGEAVGMAQEIIRLGQALGIRHILIEDRYYLERTGKSEFTLNDLVDGAGRLQYQMNDWIYNQKKRANESRELPEGTTVTVLEESNA